MPCSRRLRPLARTRRFLPRCFRCRMMGDTPRSTWPRKSAGRERRKALAAQLAGLTRQRPVLMIVEDAHWVDPTSLEVFGRTVDQIKTLPVLLIVTFRPEFDAALGWTVACDDAWRSTGSGSAKSPPSSTRVVGNKALPADVTAGHHGAHRRHSAVRGGDDKGGAGGGERGRGASRPPPLFRRRLWRFLQACTLR